MNRALLPALALAALASGCVKENRTGIELSKLCTMPDDCKFSSTCSMQPLGELVLDVGKVPWMWLAVEVHNNLEPNDEGERLDTHNAHATRFEVSYSVPSDITMPGSASGSLSEVLIPSGGTSVVGFNAITADVGDALQSQIPVSTPDVPIYEQITAKVTLHGTLGDMSSWESGSMSLPILVCNGCVAVPTCEAGSYPVACPSAGQYPRGKTECSGG